MTYQPENHPLDPIFFFYFKLIKFIIQYINLKSKNENVSKFDIGFKHLVFEIISNIIKVEIFFKMSKIF